MEQEIFYNQKKKDITIIGAAIIDILAGPVTPDVFRTGSWPVDTVKLSFGGDALNEAAVLAKFGKNVELVSKVGLDDAGERVLDYMERLGLPTDSIVIEDGLATSMNLVLVDGCGERCFLTNPAGSLRRLTLQDVEKYLDGAADLVSFAGMFVSPQLDIPAMEQLFRTIKQKPGRTLAVDMTKAKNGERLDLPVRRHPVRLKKWGRLKGSVPWRSRCGDLPVRKHEPKRYCSHLVQALAAWTRPKNVACQALSFCLTILDCEVLPYDTAPIR